MTARLDRPAWSKVARDFIRERLQAKLDKVSDEDPKRQELLAQHEPAVWLEDAARRVQQIQAVTHSLKPIHPDARGTNLYVEPAQQPPLAELGSHALGADFAGDVVGNAAALDVYKFLKLQVGGQSLLSALLANDAAALQALHDDPAQAKVLRDAFVSLTEPRAGGPSSHGRAKQMYWLTGHDATDNGQYELLAPLYATSLAHAVYGEIQEHRFGEANKAARTARRERKAHDGVFHDYPGLAAQKMGGTKPQNISQLNSERGGVNYLLSSMPPQGWTSSNVRLPVHQKSVFKDFFGKQPQVFDALRDLRHFLSSNPPKNKKTRMRLENLVDLLTYEVVVFAESYHQTLAAGWTEDQDKFSELDKYQQLWLDPRRTELDDESPFMEKPNSTEMLTFKQAWHWMDWPAEIMKAFAGWLSGELGAEYGDAEFRHWRKELFTSGFFRRQLRELRDMLNAPNYIPVGKTHAELVADRGEPV